MASTAVSAPAAAPAKVAKKKTAAKPKKTADHPKYAEMIQDALTNLKERGGSSRVAILKFIIKKYNLAQCGGKHEHNYEAGINHHLKLALRAGIKNGTLKQSKGTGAAGSFRIGEKKTKAAKKPKVAKKPKAAKKPKKAGAEGKTKKPKAAKKSPVKASKPSVAKKPKVSKAAKPKAPKAKKAAAPKAKKPAAKK